MRLKNWPLLPTAMFHLRRKYFLPSEEKRDVDIVLELMVRKVEINLIKIISFIKGFIVGSKGVDQRRLSRDILAE